jgi:primosomal protein N''
MSDRQIERISQILSSTPVRKEDLDDWDLRLTCDHVVRRAQHRDHDRYAARVADCPCCATRRGVVTARRSGPTDDPDGRVHQQRLAAELQEAHAKLARQRKALTATEVRITELTRKLGSAGR